MNLISKIYAKISKYGMKNVCERVLQYKIYIPIDRKVSKICQLLFRNCKLKNTIILESHNDFDSNGGAFYNYLIENGYHKNYKIVWLLRNKKPKYLPSNVSCYNMNKPSIRKVYYISTAKYILCCHNFIEACRSDQISVYLTHGAIGLKNTKGKVTLPSGITYCLYPSKFLERVLADQYVLPLPNSKMKILGYPVHDFLYSNYPGDLFKVTHDRFKKVLLWMPTFRQSVDWHRVDTNKAFHLGIPIIQTKEEYVKLNTFLEIKNILLIIKIHPMQDLRMMDINTLSNIIVLDRNSVKELGIDNYRLMKDMDALISDYSSAANDFLHLNRPIAYTIDDIDDYNLGFIVEDPKELMAGNLINSINDFFDFICDVEEGIDRYKEERQDLFNKMFDYHDGNSCRRLADFLHI